MYIEDEELREIYRVTSAEHLQKLEQGLIILEKNPDDRATLEEFLRETHTLKGDSRMLGVIDVESLMHEIEECLAPIDRREEKITSELCDRLYQGVDAANKIVREAITGEPAGVNTVAILTVLRGNSIDLPSILEPQMVNNNDSGDLFAEFQAFAADFSSIEETSSQEDDLFSAPAPSPMSIAETDEPQQNKTKQHDKVVADYRINTIRVEPEKLDSLMVQTNELNIIKLKFANRIKEIEETIALWEEWSRDVINNRMLWQNLASIDKLDQKERLEAFDRRFTSRLQQMGALLSQIQGNSNDDTARLETIADRLESGVKNLRLLPLGTMFKLFPRMVRDLARQQGKEVEFIIEGDEIMADKRILEGIKDPLMHLLRNAIDHGIETPAERQGKGKPPKATVCLIASQNMGKISIVIIDDGRGLDIENIKQSAIRKGIYTQNALDTMTDDEIQNLIFTSGFSTRTNITEISGRGIGMDVVRSNIEGLKGSISVNSNRGSGCQFVLKLPTSVSTTQVLIAKIQENSYAIPIEAVDRLLLLSHYEIFALQGKQSIVLDNNPIPAAWLSDLLELPASVPDSANISDLDRQNLSCLILQQGVDRLALLVDAITDQQNIVIKPPNRLLQKIPYLSGTVILGNGEICTVLNTQELLAARYTQTLKTRTIDKNIAIQKRSLLLVEDSLVIRTQLKRILEGAGYNVTVAVDGLEGFAKLQTNSIDLVVSDVEMPNLSGLQLTAKIREYSEYNELPVILVTTLAKEEDRRRGAEVGANAYLTKGDFDQKLLLETIERLI
jgi:two-component system, chemotaxis family, sensor kinase CheA